MDKRQLVAEAIVAVARRLTETMYAMMQDDADYQVRPFWAGGLKSEALSQKVLAT